MPHTQVFALVQHIHTARLLSCGSGHLRLEPGWLFKTLDFHFGFLSFICLSSFSSSCRSVFCSPSSCWSRFSSRAVFIRRVCVPAGANISPVMAEPDSLGYIFTQHSPLLFCSCRLWSFMSSVEVFFECRTSPRLACTQRCVRACVCVI